MRVFIVISPVVERTKCCGPIVTLPFLESAVLRKPFTVQPVPPTALYAPPPLRNKRCLVPERFDEAMAGGFDDGGRVRTGDAG
ncbi:hypothetical protein [Sphingomonas sp.]|uniref:hypothetical protein n=1 Tax=Sphingomonas sp. TaxID=28214 RepID=UPI002EDA2820